MPVEYSYNPIDLLPDVALGVKLPFNASGAGRAFNTNYQSVSSDAHVFTSVYTTEEQAISNLKNLILTRKGERLYHPTFGCDLQDMIFENINNDIALNTEVSDSMTADINYWLPYIEIVKINVGTLSSRASNNSINGFAVLLNFKVSTSNINREIEIFIDNSGVNII